MELKYTIVNHPVHFTKDDDGKVFLHIEQAKIALPKEINKEIDFTDRKAVAGLITTECSFEAKFDREKHKYNIIKNDDEGTTLSAGPHFFKADGIDITNPTSLPGFYDNDPEDTFFTALYTILELKLKEGELDGLLEGKKKPWTEDEAVQALEIYFRTVDADTDGEKIVIEEFISSGKLNRSYNSIRMMVHGLRSLDSENGLEGLSNTGKVFRDIWETYKSFKPEKKPQP